MAMMNASDVVELLNRLEEHGIDVWLNGGWGVDALLGHQTREHDDLVTRLGVELFAFEEPRVAHRRSRRGGGR